MTPIPCIEEFPFRFEVTDLSTDKKEVHYVKTEKEVTDRLADTSNDNLFVAGWNRRTQDLIGMTHEEVV